MATTLRYRLFGIGRMPAAIRPPKDAAVLLFAEGIAVAMRANGQVPGGGLAYGFYRTKCGAFFFAPDRIMASVSSIRVIDLPFASADPSGAAKIRIQPDGLHLAIDLARAVPGARGELQLHFREELAEPVRSALPSCDLAFQIDPELVSTIFRQRKTL